MNIKKKYLDKKAIEYVLYKLQCGLQISQSVFNLHQHQQGKVYTYIESDVDEHKLYSFKSGFKGLDYEAIEEYIIKEIQEHLKVKNNIVIFEDSLLNTQDNLSRLISNRFFNNNRIYYYLNSQYRNYKDVSKTIAGSSNSWQNVFFFSSLPNKMMIVQDSNVSDEIIHILGSNTTKAVVDAYDLDGYVIWELVM